MNEEQVTNARKYLCLVRKEIEGLAAAGSPQSAAWYAKALAVIAEIENQTDTELVSLYQSMKDNPSLTDLPMMLANSKKSLETLLAIPIDAISKVQSDLDTSHVRQDINCSQDNCGTYPSEVDVAIAELVAATLELGAAIAAAAKVIIPETIAGFTNPAYIVAAAIEAGLTVDARSPAKPQPLCRLMPPKSKTACKITITLCCAAFAILSISSAKPWSVLSPRWIMSLN